MALFIDIRYPQLQWSFDEYVDCKGRAVTKTSGLTLSLVEVVGVYFTIVVRTIHKTKTVFMLYLFHSTKVRKPSNTPEKFCFFDPSYLVITG